MKKKSLFLSMLTIMMMAIMSVSFGACSDNDDDSSSGSSVVGTWVSGTTTIVFGSDGSFNLTDTSIPRLTQYRRGTYSYNPNQNLLVINVVAVAGQNGAYKDTYIVQTLNASTLVLLSTDGEVGYYTRK